jgi:lysyl-tRNA synthetase class 2
MITEPKNREQENRQLKLQQLIASGIPPYPARFDKEVALATAKEQAVGTVVCTAGRMIRFREMGKISFAHLMDHSGTIQIIFKQEVLGPDLYRTIVSSIDLGDFMGAKGEIFVTKTGEISILVKEWSFLGKALLPLPDKFHGLKGQESLYRQR